MKTIRLENFAGINNKALDKNMSAGFLRNCKNFTIDNSGYLRQRPGYVQKLSGDFRNLWSDGKRCFAVRNGNLVEIYRPFGTFFLTALLYSDIGNYPVYFEVVAGKYFFNSDLANGIIQADRTVISAGMEKVTGVPTLTASAGNGSGLPAGKYLIACTYFDDVTLQESGVGEITSIELTADQQINISNLPVSANPRVSKINIYMTTVNGTELMFALSVNNAVGSYSIWSFHYQYLAIPLSTFGLDKMPLGTITRYHYGRLFVVSGQTVYYSVPQSYELFDLRYYLAYTANVTAFLPVDDGIWISADALYFVSGRNPTADDFSQRKVSDVTVYQNSERLIENRFLGLDGYNGNVWAVMSSDGLLLLGNGGFMLNVSRDKYKPTAFNAIRGAVIERDDGFNYIAFLQI